MNYRERFLGLFGFLFVAVLALTGGSQAYALVDLNVGAGVNASANASSSSNAGSKTEVKSSTSLEAESGMGEVQGSSNLSASSSVNVLSDMSADKVESDGDLQAYAETALRNDESLSDVSFTDDTVTVKYKEKGRFLALVPMTFTVSAKAHADGTLELDYPWYSFLTLDSQDELETDLRIAVDNAIRAQAVGSVRAEGQAENATLSASERAVIAAEMHTILKARLAGEGL